MQQRLNYFAPPRNLRDLTPLRERDRPRPVDSQEQFRLREAAAFPFGRQSVNQNANLNFGDQMGRMTYSPKPTPDFHNNYSPSFIANGRAGFRNELEGGEGDFYGRPSVTGPYEQMIPNRRRGEAASYSPFRSPMIRSSSEAFNDDFNMRSYNRGVSYGDMNQNQPFTNTPRNSDGYRNSQLLKFDNEKRVKKDLFDFAKANLETKRRFNQGVFCLFFVFVEYSFYLFIRSNFDDSEVLYQKDEIQNFTMIEKLEGKEFGEYFFYKAIILFLSLHLVFTSNYLRLDKTSLWKSIKRFDVRLIFSMLAFTYLQHSAILSLQNLLSVGMGPFQMATITLARLVIEIVSWHDFWINLSNKRLSSLLNQKIQNFEASAKAEIARNFKAIAFVISFSTLLQMLNKFARSSESNPYGLTFSVFEILQREVLYRVALFFLIHKLMMKAYFEMYKFLTRMSIEAYLGKFKDIDALLAVISEADKCNYFTAEKIRWDCLTLINSNVPEFTKAFFNIASGTQSSLKIRENWKKLLSTIAKTSLRVIDVFSLKFDEQRVLPPEIVEYIFNPSVDLSNKKHDRLKVVGSFELIDILRIKIDILKNVFAEFKDPRAFVTEIDDLKYTLNLLERIRGIVKHFTYDLPDIIHDPEVIAKYDEFSVYLADFLENINSQLYGTHYKTTPTNFLQ